MSAADLERLKAVYKTWNDTKGLGDVAKDAWRNLFADDFRLRSMGDDNPALAFATERTSKEDAIAYITSLTNEWDMIHWTPETMVIEGDRIAVFGKCKWTNKATQKAAEVRTSHLWTFKNGKAVELVEIFDSARAVAAATP